MNDRQILARLEAASPNELSSLLRRPSDSESRVYRAYFGVERYEALRRKTLSTRRVSRAAKRGNVVILHGIMGGELTVRQEGWDKSVWMNLFRLAFGGMGRLAMKNGESVYDVRATGILKKWYAEQILELSDDWNVQTYWYDWRRDLNEIADDLLAKIGRWFGGDAPVNLVAHSMGGLVSRTYIARHPKRWNKGGKLIMLGTPNHGSFSIPQVITGANATVRKLALLDVTRSLEEVTAILSGLSGALEMLPSPLVMPTMEPLYQSKTWGWRTPQVLLDRARRHHELLANVIDGDRMSYIAGCNRPTHDGISDWTRLDTLDAYSSSMEGDGTVPHRLGFLQQNGTRIPTWFIQEDHGALPNNARVIDATKMLLVQDKCNLSATPEGARSVSPDQSGAQGAMAGGKTQRSEDETRLLTIVDRLYLHSRGTAPPEDASVSREETEAVEIVLRGFLGNSRSDKTGTAHKVRQPRIPRKAPPSIEIALLRADIAELPASERGVPRVDAISVGHYIGVTPQYAELALDRAISGWKDGDSDNKLVLTALHKRGAIAARLGQQYLVPDPRQPDRLVVLVGMGNPGGFRIPELTVAVRELAWTLGRMRRCHLASVLIGSGVGNLNIPHAVNTWVRGLRRALLDAQTVDAPQLERLTFIENSPASFVRLHRALSEEANRSDADSRLMKIIYEPPSKEQLDAAVEEAKNKAAQRAFDSIDLEMNAPAGNKASAGNSKDPEPIRFTVGLSNRTYEFSVMTSEASIPQRTTTVDPRLIESISGDLVIASSYAQQRDLGNLLGRMLVPTELRGSVIQPGVPTVLSLDATTARIHFELAALSAAAGNDEFEESVFMGTAASLTRQLRTTFAPLPEPAIIAGHVLRVLVIADPCEEAPLAGAQEEGEAVAELFEQFGETGADVEVVRLFGPSEATRVSVLNCLVNQHFDIVHYAGHCFFDADDPRRSGWLFSNKEVLSADELNRIDRVPRFVFSNACESGITPDRADKYNAGIAPSFAESFFARGVGNFICTAWPVDDAAALAFAKRVYRGLLGLQEDQPKAEPLHEAMKAARLEIALLGDGGLATWGAYQHYGDPYFRIGLRSTSDTSEPSNIASNKSPSASRRKKRVTKQKRT